MTFHGADDASCWSDPNGRIMVNSMADARTLLDAHGFAIGPEIPHPEGLVRDWRYTVIPKADAAMRAALAAEQPVDEATQLREQLAQRDASLSLMAEQLSQRDAEIGRLRAEVASLSSRLAQGKGGKR